MSFSSMDQIIELCHQKEIPFYKAILFDDCEEREVKESDSLKDMASMWDAMYAAAQAYDGTLQSASGLVGGQGQKMANYCKREHPIGGDFIGKVIAQALQMGESNACMKRIVAAPTAGACGVLPAVLVPMAEEYHISREQIIESMYVAAGIGQVIASRAYIAGAAGGCQAEIGSASAMAAGALTALRGGTPEQIASASAMALKNLLGLVCDPVAGLVEVPCVKRNVIGAVGAVSAADMALAGIESRIPADQVFDAMKEIGDKMDVSLRETSQGGLATSTEGQMVKEWLSENN